MHNDIKNMHIMHFHTTITSFRSSFIHTTTVQSHIFDKRTNKHAFCDENRIRQRKMQKFKQLKDS